MRSRGFNNGLLDRCCHKSGICLDLCFICRNWPFWGFKPSLLLKSRSLVLVLRGGRMLCLTDNFIHGVKSNEKGVLSWSRDEGVSATIMLNWRYWRSIYYVLGSMKLPVATIWLSWHVNVPEQKASLHFISRAGSSFLLFCLVYCCFSQKMQEFFFVPDILIWRAKMQDAN